MFCSYFGSCGTFEEDVTDSGINHCYGLFQRMCEYLTSHFDKLLMKEMRPTGQEV